MIDPLTLMTPPSNPKVNRMNKYQTYLLQCLGLMLDRIIKEDVNNQPRLNQGICWCIEVELHQFLKGHVPTMANCLYEMRILWKRWPKFSGDAMYPIPATLLRRLTSGREAANMYFNRSLNGTGRRRRLRIELIKWMIAELEKLSTPTT